MWQTRSRLNSPELNPEPNTKLGLAMHPAAQVRADWPHKPGDQEELCLHHQFAQLPLHHKPHPGKLATLLRSRTQTGMAGFLEGGTTICSCHAVIPCKGRVAMWSGKHNPCPACMKSLPACTPALVTLQLDAVSHHCPERKAHLSCPCDEEPTLRLGLM
jgi:hypothetical protein